MTTRPLRAVGVALTIVTVALLTWVMQRDGDVVPVSDGSVAAGPAQSSGSSGGSSAPSQTLTPTPTQTPTPTRTPTPTPSRSPTSAGSPTRATTPPSAPTRATQGLRIRIPAIGLDHVMAGAGLSPKGTIDPPSGTVMWFKGFERVRPGRVGTAVVAAHVATGSRPDVFADLADVDVGDTVEVFEEGKAVRYRVTRAGAIDKKKVTTDQAVWGANTSRTRLAIITCDDAYGLRGDGHRVANFVVIADKI